MKNNMSQSEISEAIKAKKKRINEAVSSIIEILHEKEFTYKEAYEILSETRAYLEEASLRKSV